MATLATSFHIPLCGQRRRNQNLTARAHDSRKLITSALSQNSDTDPKIPNKASAEENIGFGGAFNKFKRLGEGLKDNLSPKRKGDWKDLTLMSLSFAVYVYMSQKIVCAYCVWLSILRQQQW